jgi:hypothetical protein
MERPLTEQITPLRCHARGWLEAMPPCYEYIVHGRGWAPGSEWVELHRGFDRDVAVAIGQSHAAEYMDITLMRLSPRKGAGGAAGA